MSNQSFYPAFLQASLSLCWLGSTHVRGNVVVEKCWCYWSNRPMEFSSDVIGLEGEFLFQSIELTLYEAIMI